MTRNITENINKTEIITKKIISLFIPICLLLISFSLINCPDPGTDASTPGNGNGNGNGNGGGQPDVPPQIIVEYRSGVINKDVTQSGLLLSLRDEPVGDVTVSITVRRSDGSGTATVNLGGSTATATETISFIFTQQNWNIPQEFKLVYGNPIDPDDPDPANVRIVFKTTSTADTAYNNLIYYFSGDLTHLGVPEFRIHVHNAQSPEPEGTAGTNDRNMKVWFSIEPSIASTGQAAVCAAEGGLWSDPHCVITSINACEKAYGAGTWDSATSTCGSTITAEAACTASGNTWDSGNSTCAFITAEAACTASGNAWDSDTCVITAETACTASGNAWDSNTCVITEEKACRALSNTTGTWNDTTDTCVSPITVRGSCLPLGYTWDSDDSTCIITAEKACLATSGNTWDGTDTCFITAETACLATSINTWDGTDTCFITAETACLATTGNAWNSTTSTCASITAEAVCTASGKNWDGTTSTCVSYITAEVACENIHETWDSANNICTVDIEETCIDSGNNWDGSDCGPITAEDACLATSGNAWVDVSGTDTCKSSGGSDIEAEDACLATSGNVWNSATETCGSIGAEDACAATLHGTWDSANDRCVVMPETACEEARGVWNSSNSTCYIAPKLACNTALHTWINKAEPVCAITNPQSHDSDITITYTVTDTASASAGTDYTAPTTTTVTIPASKTSAYIEIPLVADLKAATGVTPDDDVDETFKVSITSVSTSGADLSVADANATVTIGDPNETSYYFFPNRPLMRGEKAEAATTPTAGGTPSFECYLVNDTEDPFSSTIAFVGINNSSGITLVQLKSTGIIDDIIALSEYGAESVSNLLSFGNYRPFIRLFFNPAGSGYNPINNYSYSCRSSFNDGAPFPPVKSVPRGPFGQLEFGQAYEYK